MMSKKTKTILWILILSASALFTLWNRAFGLAALFFLMDGYYIWLLASGKASPYQNPFLSEIRERKQQEAETTRVRSDRYETYREEIERRFDDSELDEAIREEEEYEDD